MINNFNVSRRALLTGAAGVAATPFSEAGEAVAEQYLSFETLNQKFPPESFEQHLVMEVLAEVGESFTVGEGPNGVRRVVPIIGGRFRTSDLTGVVLPGGADRQTIRSDGIRELDATYELKGNDGTVFMIRNRAIVDAEEQPEGWSRYVRSVVKITTPAGPHDWLNRRVIVGSLHSLRPEKPLVLLRFFVLE